MSNLDLIRYAPRWSLPTKPVSPPRNSSPIAVQQLAFAKEALRLTQESLKSGTGLTVDVLQAEDAAAQARYRYATAIVRYNQSAVNLLAALGLIDQATLLPVTAASPPAPD